VETETNAIDVVAMVLSTEVSFICEKFSLRTGWCEENLHARFDFSKIP
jgi:hypothetical protein